MQHKQFALTDRQEIIELQKDCGCMDNIHTGPHWLHMDRYDREANQVHLARATAGPPDAVLGQQALATQELVRLREKKRQFASHGLCKILQQPVSLEDLLELTAGFHYQDHFWMVDSEDAGASVTVWFDGGRHRVYQNDIHAEAAIREVIRLV